MTFVLTTTTEDLVGDIVKLEGIDISQFQRNPVMLFQHWGTPVGSWENLRKKDGKLLADPVFSDTPAAQNIKKLVDEGHLRGASIGFRIKEKHGKVITSCLLLEASIVALPCNIDALKKSIEQGSDVSKSIPHGKEDILRKYCFEKTLKKEFPNNNSKTMSDPTTNRDNQVDLAKENEALQKKLSEVQRENFDNLCQYHEIEATEAHFKLYHADPKAFQQLCKVLANRQVKSRKTLFDQIKAEQKGYKELTQEEINILKNENPEQLNKIIEQHNK